MANKLTFLVLACVLFASSAWSQQQIEGFVRGAGPGAGVPQRSEAELKAEIAAQPAQLRAYLELAQLYKMNKRMQDAEAVLRSALSATAQADAVFSMLISLYPATYNPDEVLSIAEEWRRMSPNNVRPVLFAANAHVELARRFRMGRPQDAAAEVDQALRAVEDAKAMNADDFSLFSTHANALRMKAELETDPTERARLMQQADALMQQARTRANMPGPQMQWQAGATMPSAPPNARMPVRVGGGIAAPVKIRDVPPVYPPDALQARVQGVVIVEIVIGEDGKITGARVLRSIPALDQAALDAVQQWEFTPTLLNGQPVPVIMTATVNFTLR